MEVNDFILNGDVNVKNAHVYEKLAKIDEENDKNRETSEDTDNAVPKPRVVNIAACVDYGVNLDLVRIVSSTRNSEYNPKRFPAVTIRNSDPKAVAIAFRNGKVNIVGCRTYDTTFKAAKCFGRLFKKIGIEGVKIKSFQISNIVGVMNCGFPIHLESIAAHKGHMKFATYNPEIFAGLIYRFPLPKTTLIIFVSGRLIITGAKTEEDLVKTADGIYPILQQFNKPNL